MTGGVSKMMSTYSLYVRTALSCDDSCGTAAVGEYVFLPVTPRAVKHLREQKGGLVLSINLLESRKQY